MNEPFNKHQSINTLYGAWTVCGFTVSLYKWNTNYKCLKENYFTEDSVPAISILSEMESLRLLSNSDYTKSEKNFAIRELVKNQ